MKILLFIVTLVSFTSTTNNYQHPHYKAKLEGTLSEHPSCKLVLINRFTNKKIKDTIIKFFEVTALDSTSIGDNKNINAKNINDLPNLTIYCVSDTLCSTDFKKNIWDRLPNGHRYYIWFHNILCGRTKDFGTFEDASVYIENFKIEIKK